MQRVDSLPRVAPSRDRSVVFYVFLSQPGSFIPSPHLQGIRHARYALQSD